jgi:hypothetical protein
LDFWDFEAIIVDQVKTLPVLLEGSEMFANIIPFFGSCMPEVSDDCDSSLLAFVLIDGLEIFPGNVRGGTMLDVNDRFVTYVLCDKVFGIIVVFLPVVMADRIFIPIWLLDFPVNVGFNLT